ncbi:hypothetical protein [Nonomuraea sp. NPDC005650]|uniref:hypothetical protein n=1 Tax=Nonomuraea sp. NPDC005650 TaxID=3157045 RepID=UPI0033ABC685
MINFSWYRRFCDESNAAFRKLGLVDEEQYARAMRDTRTVPLQVGDQIVPALCPIEYATGYDGPRTRKLTSHDATFLLTVPPAFLSGLDTERLPAEFAVLVESDHADTETYKEELRKRFPRSTECDFADPRARAGAASMIAYAATFRPREEAEPKGEEGAVLLDPHALGDDARVANELWDLYSDRFAWLGKHHPVSMEESQSTFTAALFHEDTRTLVKFEQNRPVCVGLFMEGLDHCDWLAPSFRQNLQEQAAARNEGIRYFYGIASSARAGEAYAEDVMALLGKVIWESGKACRLVFESTNLSSDYIPVLVERRAQESPYIDFTPGSVATLGRVDYWYLTVNGWCSA